MRPSCHRYTDMNLLRGKGSCTIHQAVSYSQGQIWHLWTEYCADFGLYVWNLREAPIVLLDEIKREACALTTDVTCFVESLLLCSITFLFKSLRCKWKLAIYLMLKLLLRNKFPSGNNKRVEGLFIRCHFVQLFSQFFKLISCTVEQERKRKDYAQQITVPVNLLHFCALY